MIEMKCIFCDGIDSKAVIRETNYFKIVFDINPMQQGHILIISKAHKMDLRELDNLQSIELLMIEKEMLTIFEHFSEINGVTIFQNNGNMMDEGTHFHVHMLPRYEHDSFWKQTQINQRPLDIKALKALINQLEI